MKKLLALTMMGLMLTVIFAACRSSKTSCDAYGSAQDTEQVDIAE